MLPRPTKGSDIPPPTSPSSRGHLPHAQGVSRAISVARRVMEESVHSFLVGRGASTFARSQGFEWDEVLSPAAREEWLIWKGNEGKEALQVDGREEESAGVPAPPREGDAAAPHDTVGLLVLDAHGNLAAGTSTSGWRFKHPGTFAKPLFPSLLFSCFSILVPLSLLPSSPPSHPPSLSSSFLPFLLLPSLPPLRACGRLAHRRQWAVCRQCRRGRRCNR